MADEVPSGNYAVFAFLELLAAAFIFEGVSALLNGTSWRVCLPALAGGTIFFLVGVKTPWIKSKFTSVDWELWGNRINHALIVVCALAVIAVMASGYFALHEASLLFHNLARHLSSLSAPRQTAPQVPQSRNTAPAPKPPSTPKPQDTGTARFDWHDKHNWRGHLQVGMTKTEVRRLFGEADTISVSSELEDWDYGHGWITFIVNKDSPDGEIYSWHEPY